MSTTKVEHMMHNKRNLQIIKYVGVAIFSALVTFSISLVSFSGARTVTLTLAQPYIDTSATDSTPAEQNLVTTGQAALTELELLSAVKAVGGAVYWVGTDAEAKYAFNNVSDTQKFIRYLPSGEGLTDTAQNYRIIATYKDPAAYKTMQDAAKLNTGVAATNPDGSIVYYLKTTPLHVYVAFKDFPYQIEIYDPTPGAALKLATTPGMLKTIS